MDKVKFTWDEAEALAEACVNLLEPKCYEIKYAGSIRRMKPEVGDIEIVADPMPGVPDDQLFALPAPNKSALDYFDYSKIGKIVKNGPRYKKIELPEGINLDLFIVLPPATFGVILAIRTGPADFSRLMVTHRSTGGWLPDGYYCREGSIYHYTEKVAGIGERDLLDLTVGRWIDPEDREAYAADWMKRRRGR